MSEKIKVDHNVLLLNVDRMSTSIENLLSN